MDELKAVTARKFPTKTNVVDSLLAKMSYEYVYTPDAIDELSFSIRDLKDYPVLYTAIWEDIDVLITGDKDFENLNVERPDILTPAEFIRRFCQ